MILYTFKKISNIYISITKKLCVMTQSLKRNSDWQHYIKINVIPDFVDVIDIIIYNNYLFVDPSQHV